MLHFMQSVVAAVIERQGTILICQRKASQKHALKWILEGACALPVWAYRGDTRETDIALGRQFVGQQIMGAMRVNISRLKKREETING